MSITISGGIFDHMVMQRDAAGVCDQRITGAAAPEVKISADLPDRGNVVLGVSGKDGSFSVRLKGLPCGGPYEVVLRAGEESIRFADLLVGDVWMLAGQSNMQGIGPLTEAPDPDPLVRAFYLDDHWGEAAEPLHDLRIARANVHWKLQGGQKAAEQELPPPVKGVGPGLFFGKEMLKRTGIPQGLIASAHGGTCMEQWDAGRRDAGDDSLYGAMYNRFVANGSSVAGILWYQGCSDTHSDRVGRYHRANLDFFRALRRDFGDPRLPVVMVQIGRSHAPHDREGNRCWSAVREIQRKLPDEFDFFLTVPAIDLEYSDAIHLSGRGHRILAGRMADAMENIRGNSDVLPPIEVAKIESRKVPEYSEVEVSVSFRNLSGNLQSGGSLPLGFSFHFADGDNEKCTQPFRVRLEGDRAVLSTGIGGGACRVSYGFGCNPAVNVHDGAGRSLPAFGPLFFRKQMLTTAMLDRAEVSEPVMLGKTDFDDLIPVREKLEKLKFEKIVSGNFFIGPERILEKGDYMRFIRWYVEAPRDGVWRGLLGADGAVRIFMDGREVAGYPDVANPVIADEFEFPVEMKRGRHEFIAGFDGKSGNAWGLCFHFGDPKIILSEESGGESVDKLLASMPAFID